MGIWIPRTFLILLVSGAAALAALQLRLRRRPPPPPVAEPGRHAVALLDTRRVVPSPGLPAGFR
jgi:hypothetical protein